MKLNKDLMDARREYPKRTIEILRVARSQSLTDRFEIVNEIAGYKSQRRHRTPIVRTLRTVAGLIATIPAAPFIDMVYSNTNENRLENLLVAGIFLSLGVITATTYGVFPKSPNPPHYSKHFERYIK